MIASVGHVSAHAPQDTQDESSKPESRPAVMLAWKPRPVAVSANAPCTSSQARTQRPQEMQSSCWNTRYGWRASCFAARGRRPVQRGAPTPSSRGDRGELGVRRGRLRQLGEDELDHVRGDPQRALVVVTIRIPSRHGVVQDGERRRRALDRRRGRRGRRRRRDHAVVEAERRHASGRPGAPPRARSSRARPRPSTAVDEDLASRRAPARRGSGRSGSGSAPACPPPCAQRLATSSVSSSSSSVARSTAASASTISSPRWSPIRQGKHLPQLSWAPKCSRCAAELRACRCARRRRRSRRGRPCSPRPPARRSRTASRAAEPGRIPPSGPPI